MSRSPRILDKHLLHHVTTRGNGQQLIFDDNDDRRRYLYLLAGLAEKLHIDIIAWCLMENHTHLLVRDNAMKLSDFMHALNGRYAQYFNRRYERVGSVFQGRFFSKPITDDAYFLTVLRYIIRNPEADSLAAHDSYPWNSYWAYFKTGVRSLSHEKSARSQLRATQINGKAWSVADIPVDVETVHAQAGTGQVLREFFNMADDAMVDCGQPPRTFVGDDVAKSLARHVTGLDSCAGVKAFPRARRDVILRQLKSAGLTLRQISRLTGIGKGIIQRA